MASREPYKSLLELEIGERMHVDPDPGEDIERALRRYKKRFSTWRKKQLSFVAEISGSRIEVTRTEFGKNKKLWRWEAMKAGEIMVLASDPDESEIRSARNTANYLMSVKGVGGVWSVDTDRSGRLLVRCLADSDGNSVGRPRPITDDPEDERAMKVRVLRYLADRLRAGAPKEKGMLRAEVLGKAANLDAEADAFEAGFGEV